MKKGIIMEINGSFLTLLTPDGEFLHAKKQTNDQQIGQEIDFFPIMMAKNRNKPFFLGLFDSVRQKAALITVTAVLLMAVSFLPIYQNNKVYAYMSIDVNPSLELGVNENLQVVELSSYNEEGKMILQEIKDWKKKDLSIVTEKILAEIKEQGYMKDNNELFISTVYTGDREKESDQKIMKELGEIEEDLERVELDVTIIEGTSEEREEAVQQGVTTGTLKKQQYLQSEPSSQKNNINPTRKAMPNEKQDSNKDADKNTKSIRSVDKKDSVSSKGQLKKEDKKSPPVTKEKENGKPLEKILPPGQQKKQDDSDKKIKQHGNKKDENPIIQVKDDIEEQMTKVDEKLNDNLDKLLDKEDDKQDKEENKDVDKQGKNDD